MPLDSAATSTPDLLPLPLEEGRYMVRCVRGVEAAPARPLAYTPFLYLTPAHLALQQAPGEWLHFHLEDQRSNHTVGQFQAFLAEGDTVAYSPWQAPFGGAQLAPGLPADVVASFLTVVEAQLIQRGVQRLQVRSYPLAYDEAGGAQLTQALTQQGFRITQTELNNHLPLQEEFVARLHPSERRRLRKCERHGFQFEQEPPLLLPLAYEFLNRCRQEKGQHLSLPLERLQELFRLFPQHYFLFSVRDASGEWVALTVAIRVNDEVLYNFYPASPLAYNAFSPVVLLNAGLHAFGKASGMRILDLGTSMLPEGPNYSLLQFKRHLGGVLSLKLTFEK
ncbi:GNAT family N-acetyltransferase [Hymenobacter wooponensis]|uniref:GNAT family N-acetyltransferase n=1 Tax=Hymenobacter wooponensis TaxID=1525360 RepID=A0A4Z0MN82_9BACT|nr:GNAT family N-acetyltransferase [Hymenobacter wooponensis]